MSKKIKITLIVIIVILAILGGIVALGYGYFFGFSQKSKYEKCMKACNEALILESSKSACAPRCSEITGYQSDTKTPAKVPAKTTEKKTEPAKSATETKETNPTTNTEKKYIDNETAWEDREYYCAWVWPQEIIDKNTNEPIVSCSYDRPWCDFGKDYKYDDSKCCKNYDEATKTKSDCISLPELLKAKGIR